ncbi:MAG: hypothetical protein J0H42_28925 [Rhizobiales bacterium]|nr:hypothetical protein [Hyphomicrobiales bacterium]
MIRARHAVLAAAMLMTMGTSVAAEVLDATYRGTMVCDKLPFTSDKMREAIEVTITGGAARYSHVVRLRNVAVEPTAEEGTGKIDGQKIDLQGTWKSGGREYQAKYSGSFVRRSARLKGTQTWTDDGKTVTRACAGAIKRPFKPFLPRARKQAAAGQEIATRSLN